MNVFKAYYNRYKHKNYENGNKNFRRLALISLAIDTIWLSIAIMGVSAVLIWDGFNTISKKYFKQ